jgi:hypothetical protein
MPRLHRGMYYDVVAEKAGVSARQRHRNRDDGTVLADQWLFPVPWYRVYRPDAGIGHLASVRMPAGTRWTSSLATSSSGSARLFS